MTWVVGGNCFNGFVCVADIQMTISYSDSSRNRYFNCLQKIHKVYDNLCVAFSGDVKSGLILVEELKYWTKSCIKDGEYFDIDGQSSSIINFVKSVYREINRDKCPYVELMLLWNAQEGDGLVYRPFCMKFKSPDFRLNSTPFIGLSQSGSGVNNERYQTIASFLSGKKCDTSVYEDIFKNASIPTAVTVEKFKKILFNEASKVNHLGVSKSLISYESVIRYDELYPSSIAADIKRSLIDLGVKYRTESIKNDKLLAIEVDIPEVISKILELARESPSLLEEILSFLSSLEPNYEKICDLPPLVSGYVLSPQEEIHSHKLLANWDEVQEFVQKREITLEPCSAIA